MRFSVTYIPSSLTCSKTARKGGLSVLCLLTLAACGNHAPPSGGSYAPVSKANPASVYCDDLGGKLEIRASDAGELGYCHLPDGSTIEEWKLYADQNPL